MFNQNEIYVMNQNKALVSIGESLKTIGTQLQSLAPPGYEPDPPDNLNTAAVDRPEGDAVSCEQILENCTDCLHAPLPSKGEDETMAKTKIRIRVCVGYNKDHSPVVKQISADSELELADRVAVTLMQSERRDEFIRFADGPVRSNVPLFKEYAEEWFTVYKANRLKPTTAGGYRTMLNTHLYPTWGDTPLNEITTKAIQEFLNGRSDRSRKTLQELLTLLKAILESARKDRLIEFNPADDRRLRIPSEKKTERMALSMEDERDILANISKLQRQDQRFLALLNPGSCGPRRFNQAVTLAVLEVEDGNIRVNRIDIALQGKNVALPRTENLKAQIETIMKETQKGRGPLEIAGRHGWDAALVEQIARLYVTHPGVTADGIMGKMGI